MTHAIAKRGPRPAYESADIVPLRERKLAKLWAEQDRLEAELRALKAKIVPLQREVSLGRGYLFTVSREALSRAMGRGVR